MNNSFPILYITYDGLLDPLGGSQILPYIYGIATHSGPIHILSFEKPNRFHLGKDKLALDFLSKNISWHPLIFSTNIGYLGVINKIRDFLKMYVHAWIIAKKYRIQIVHARSHVASWVALFLKNTLNVKFIFDCRGLWVDERIDKGSWNLNQLLPRLQYQYFKKRERNLFKNADHIIVLTEAVVSEAITLGANQKNKITVIPCCADFNHFKFPDPEQKINAKNLLGFQNDAIIIGYLGSIGNMYMIDVFLKFIKYIAEKRKDIFVLMVTPDLHLANSTVALFIQDDFKNNIKIISGNREHIPQFLAALDVLVSFIKPSYARLACSPTKNAEALAMGIPLICNMGIGDVEDQVNSLHAGFVVDLEKENTFEFLLNKLDDIKNFNRERIRNAAYPLFDIHVANKRYEHIYREMKNEIMKRNQN
jgi:glycosyltransferase involved in cell wall biosynthesis